MWSCTLDLEARRLHMGNPVGQRVPVTRLESWRNHAGAATQPLQRCKCHKQLPSPAGGY